MEVLITLAVIGILGALVVGNTVTWLRNAELRDTRNSIQTASLNARFYAVFYNTPIYVDVCEAGAFGFASEDQGFREHARISSDWTCERIGDPAYEAGGGCQEGELAFRNGERELRFEMRAPACRLDPVG